MLDDNQLPGLRVKTCCFASLCSAANYDPFLLQEGAKCISLRPSGYLQDSNLRGTIRVRAVSFL